MAIDQNFLQELTSRSDIVDIVSRYVSLKKNGSNYFGLCPFHNEKSPSFSVSHDKQIFHCFGCGVGGGVISFIMRIESLDFYDAVELLAKQNGMTVPKQEYKQNQNREKMLNLMRDAARFFYNELWKPENKSIQQYFAQRGLVKKTMNRFGLGFAPNSFFALTDAMKEKGYTIKELLECGLVSKNEKGNIFDKFRNRVMFPIFDIRQNVIAFGGRVIDNSKPKYLNSPETYIFHKSRNLFAIHMAKKSKKDYFILAEGYMDVIALHQAGFDNAVASLGTSLTEEQAQLISRYTKNIIISYDADNAGQEATKRAINILKKSDINIKILKIPQSKDPDEFIKQKGSQAFQMLIEQSSNDIAYNIDNIALKFNLNNDLERVYFLKECASMLANIDNNIEREIYTARAANMANISLSSFKSEVEIHAKKIQNSIQKNQKINNLSAHRNVQPTEKAYKYENINCARAEEGILSIIFADNTLIDYIITKINENDFTSHILKEFFSHAISIYKNGKDINISAFEEIFDPSAMSLLVKITNKPIPVPSLRERALNDYIYKIKKHTLKINQSANETDPLLEMAKMKKKKFGGK